MPAITCSVCNREMTLTGQTSVSHLFSHRCADCATRLSWNVILYCHAGDRDGDRSLIGPFYTLGEAYDAQKRLQPFGDTEIRRVCSVDATESALYALLDW